MNASEFPNSGFAPVSLCFVFTGEFELMIANGAIFN